MAVRRIASLALLMLAANLVFAHAAAADPISYETDIVVPGDPALASQMHDLSRLVAEEDAGVDRELTLRRRAARDLDRLGAAARAAGYYDAKLSYEINSKTKPWKVTVKVDLGAPYRLRSVRIVAPQGGVPSLAAQINPAVLGLQLGMRARSAAILDGEARLLRYYTSHGYPLAKATGHEVIIDRADHSMHVTYTVTPGPTAAFGKVEINGLKEVKSDYILNRIAWREGRPYDSNLVEATQQKFVESNLFATVRITPADSVGPDGRIPMHITVTERAPRTIGGGIYYDTSFGFGARGFWEHRNVFGEGELLHVEGTLGPNDYGLLTQFKRPAFLRPDLDLRVEGSITKLLTDAFDDRRGVVFSGLDWHIDPQLTGGLGAEFVKGTVDDDTGTQAYTLAGLPIYIRRDDTDDLLNPTRGTRLGLNATPYVSLTSSGLDFLDSRLSASGYQRLGSSDRFVLAGYARVGSITGVSEQNLPRDLRLYEGGGGSVRAYGYQRAGPLDLFGNPLGGVSSLVLSVELRTKITDTIGLVGFVDAGSVYDSSLPDLSQKLFWGPGLGVRYYSPVGPLRFDIATPIERRPGDGIIQIYISLGQAF